MLMPNTCEHWNWYAFDAIRLECDALSSWFQNWFATNEGESRSHIQTEIKTDSLLGYLLDSFRSTWKSKPVVLLVGAKFTFQPVQLFA